MAYVYLCPLCKTTFKQEPRFLEHCSSVHQIFDFEQFYVQHVLEGVAPTCGCGCGERTKWNGWKKGYTSTYVRGHNASVDNVFSNPEKMAQIVKKRVKGYEEGTLVVWNKGLSKETSEALERAAQKKSKTLKEKYQSGQIVSWQKGLTKEIDERLKKTSDTMLKRYERGEIEPWNKGLTKNTDVRLFDIAKNISLNDKTKKTNYRRFTAEKLQEIVSLFPNFTLNTNPDDYWNRHQKLEFTCNTCGETQIKSLSMLRTTPTCFNCHPKESLGQLEIFEFIKSLNVEVESSNRTIIFPKEIDIWVPSKNFGIEYNGLWWHSSRYLDKDYHELKQTSARNAGINLLSIYEDEWRDKKDLIKEMIKHRLGLHKMLLPARKCRVVQRDAKEFFERNHLEGHAKCDVTFCLVDPVTDETLAAQSLRKPFHKSYSGMYEVARSCCHSSHSIPGWLGRLTRASKEFCVSHGVLKMMTYVDNRIGLGMGYQSAGWKLEKASTGPRFWWTDGQNRYNRFKYKADKSKNMSQADVACEAGVYEIWGCSNSLYVISTSYI